MAIQTEVVYPSTNLWNGTAQLNMGPYFIPAPNKLLRAEVRGKVNFQGTTIAANAVEANFQLWAVQWVAHGAAAQDIVVTADGPHFLIREQLGSEESRVAWGPATSNGAYLAGYAVKAQWAGQLRIGSDVDLYMSMLPPTGASIPNFNVFASLRFWWS